MLQFANPLRDLRTRNPESWATLMTVAGLSVAAALGLSLYVSQKRKMTPGTPEQFNEGYAFDYYWTISHQKDDPNWIWSVYWANEFPRKLIYRGTAASFQAALDASDAYMIALNQANQAE